MRRMRSAQSALAPDLSSVACSSPSTAPPGPASRRSRARSPTRSASRTSTPGRCTAASRSPSCAAPRDPLACAIELGDAVTLDGEDVSDAIRTAQVSERASQVAARPEVRAHLVGLQRALDRHRRLRRRGPRHRHGRRAGRRAEGLSHRLARGARAPPRRAARGRRRVRCSPTSASATRATRRASTPRCSPPTTRCASTRPG